MLLKILLGSCCPESYGADLHYNPFAMIQLFLEDKMGTEPDILISFINSFPENRAPSPFSSFLFFIFFGVPLPALGYFLLLDDWERHRQAIGLDVNRVA